MPFRWPWYRDDGEGATEQRAITFQDVWGAGRDVDVTAANTSIDRALSLTSVYAATSLIADLIASFPLHGYRKVGAERTELSPQPKLVTSPSVYGSPVDWVHRCVISMALRGNAFGLVMSRDTRGYPEQVEWLHPDDVTIMDNRTEGRPDWRYQGNPVDASRLIHIPYYTVPGYVLGLSPIKAYAMAVDVGLFAQAFGRDYFRNGSIPSGILKTDQRIDDENKADQVKARFKRDSARREPVVLGSGLDYRNISIAPNESQFLATIRATANQIAVIYHLDPTLIGGEHTGSSLTYANVEQRSLDIVKIALMPYIRRIESTLFTQVPGQQYIKFNVDAFVRPDIETRYKAHSLALTDGWRSRDEIRDIEDLSPMPSGWGKFTDPNKVVTPPAGGAEKPAAKPAEGSGAGTPASGSPAASNGHSPSKAAAGSNGRGGLSAVDQMISLYGRRADPWA